MVFAPVTPDEQIFPLDLGLVPEPGAPLPVLLMGQRTFLVFYIWHDPEEIAIIEWKHCRTALLGYPNEEALEGHRLASRGIGGMRYANDVLEVINSGWIAAMEQANRAHPQHKPALFADDRHFIVLFHDDTFECVADDYAVERTSEPMGAVLGRLVREV